MFRSKIKITKAIITFDYLFIPVLEVSHADVSLFQILGARFPLWQGGVKYGELHLNSSS